MKRFLLLITIIVGLNVSSYADDIGDIVSTYGGGGSQYNDVEVVGNYAYMATSKGLRILDVSSPNTPIQVGYYEMNAQKVFISGNYAYVVNDEYQTGFRILDITNKSNPILVVDYSGDLLYVSDMVIDGNYAYIAAGNDGLLILDITTKSTPIIEGVYTDVVIYSFAVAGNVVYSGTYSSVLTVLDVTDKTSPELLGTYDNNERGLPISNVKYDSGYVYFLDDTGLTTMDVSNPGTPIFVSSYTLSGQSFRGSDIEVDGNYVYVVGYGYDNNLFIIDISTKSDPQPAGNDYVKEVRTVSINGDYAYFTCGNNGFSIYDIQDKNNPEEIVHDGVNVRIYDMDVEGSYVYAQSSSDGLVILDVKDNANPIHVGPATYMSRSGDMDLEGNYAYMASGSSLIILDTTDKLNPVEISRYTVTSNSAYISKVKVEGDYVYMLVYALGTYSLIIVDVTIKDSPQPAGSDILSGYPGVIEVSDSYVYLAAGGIMTIIDATDKENPEFVASYDQTTEGSSIGAIDIQGNYAHIVESYGVSTSLIIVDISNKVNLLKVGDFVMDQGKAIEVSGKYAYIATDAGVSIVDVSEKTNPVETGNYPISGDGLVYDLSLEGNYAYISKSDDGLVIMKVRDAVNITPIITYLLF